MVFLDVLDLLNKVVGKKSPPGSLMVIYHSRIRKTPPTKQTQDE